MKNRRALVPIVAGVGALAVAAATARGRGQALDRRAYRAINGRWGTAGDALFTAITEFGSIWASIGAGAALTRLGRRREALDALGAAGAMWVLGQILKRLYLRPRPYHALEDVRLLIGEPRGTSWPSSHPAVLFAFLTVVGRNLEAPPALRLALTGLAGAVGVSRVYVGVHYPADVAGGMLLGRGVADLWSGLVSGRTLGRPPSLTPPGTVSG